jgi:hypothetical protein
MKTGKLSLAIALSLLLLLTLLTGCSASGGDKGSLAPADSYDALNYSDEAENYQSSNIGSAAGDTGVPQTQKLIYTVTLSIETLDYETSTEKVSELCAAHNGYVEYSNVSNNGIDSSFLRSASYTLRIPAGTLDAFTADCSGVGVVTSTQRETVNSTAQYVDLSAKLKSLQTEETRLLELLGQAGDLNSLIALNARLSEVRYEIESIQSSLRNIDINVDYSTIRIYLQEVIVNSKALPVPRTFGERVSAASRSAGQSFKNAMASLGVFIFGTLPLNLLLLVIYLLPLAAVAVVIVIVVRRGIKRRGRDRDDI